MGINQRFWVILFTNFKQISKQRTRTTQNKVVLASLGFIVCTPPPFCRGAEPPNFEKSGGLDGKTTFRGGREVAGNEGVIFFRGVKIFP